MNEFHVLGPVRAYRNGAAVTPSSLMQQRLLAVLLCQPREPVTVSALSDALWNDAPPPSARKSVQIYVHRLRQALGDADRIVYDAAGYTVVVGPDELDALRFMELLVRARDARRLADNESACADFGKALGLWRGSAYAGIEGIPLVAEEAQRLEQERMLAYEELIEASWDLGRHAEFIPDLAKMARSHPYRERLRAYLMVALFRVGRQAEALEVYRQTHAMLDQQLGIEPGEMLKSVHEAVLRGDTRLNQASGDLERMLAGPARDPVRSSAGGTGEQRGTFVPRWLPPDIADFTGRDEQLRQLAEHLSGGGRHATMPGAALAGGGGIGKTTLVVHLAHRLREAFPDGQLYLDLHGADDEPADPGVLLARILSALGLDGRALPDGVEQRTELFRALLADRRMLVVLDNAASERQVRPLLPSGPGCAVLVTSRRRLEGLGIPVVQLPMLDPTSACTLLERIAGKARVTAEPALAAEIVRLCDYLPLAIRIAGTRLAARTHWSLRRLADRLRQERRRLDELATGDLAVRASLVMSYRTLDESAARAFRLLGLLDAPDFTAWAAAALLETATEEAEAQLDALIDAQLLTCIGPDACGQLRYGFHDLLRLYARELAEKEESADQRGEALARALGAWLAVADGADSQIAERIVHGINGSARRWHPDAMPFTDAATWFDTERAALSACVIQACRAGMDELAWELSARTVNYYAFWGLHQDWLLTHEAALRACASAGNRRGEAVMARNLGFLRVIGIKASAAVVMERARAALATFQDLGERYGEADATGLCAFAARHRGHFDQALALTDAGMAVADLIGYELAQGRLWYVRAVIHREQGRREDAAACVEHCLTLARRAGTVHERTLALWELAASCVDEEAFDRTAAQLQEGMQLCRLRRERLLEAYLAVALGGLLIRFHRPGAAELIERALTVFDQHQVLFGQAVGLRLLGELGLRAGDHEQAIAYLQQSADRAREIRHDYELALTLKSLGNAQQANGDHEEAERTWKQTRILFQSIGNTTDADGIEAL